MFACSNTESALTINFLLLLFIALLFGRKKIKQNEDVEAFANALSRTFSAVFRIRIQ
jgi:hypothetical protein